MDFKWAKVSGAVGYNFYYKLGQYNNYSPKNTTSASYYLGNLPVGTTVYWYVNAYKNGSLGNVLNSNSLGPNSAVASKATNACKPLPGKFNLYTVSTDCAKATAVAPTDTAYNTLKWNYATNAEYYTVHWKYAKSSYQNIKIGGLDKDEYPIYSEINKKGTVISWYVTATNRYGSTNSSDPKKVGTTKVPNCY
jgi:hypothetical protein